MGLFNRKSSREEDAEVLKANDQKEKVKWSKRPANTAFKQQRLKAWQPILTPATVLPTFFLIGIIFVPIGGVLLWGSNQVKEFTIDYTQCELQTDTFSDIPSNKFSFHMDASLAESGGSAPQWKFVNDSTNTNLTTQRTCTLQFSLPSEMKKPVFMYYKLTNYYQNHRRYVKSYESGQLQGDAKSASSISGGNCKPVAVESVNGENKPVFPCGLIANSLFNDTFLPPVLVSGNVTYNMTEKGIAWPGEAKKYGPTKYAIGEAVPPPFWAGRYPDGYTDANPYPDLSQDEHFQVWMRTAGLPTFRKLYFRNDNEDMAAGTYELTIHPNYPVAPFDGTKSIVFSTVSFIGGRNPFLGIAYIAVGGTCVVLGLALTLRHLIRPRKLGDMSRLSWNTAKDK
ncbi:endosomal protein [Meredithblackwellia eburnea MCA 4105]